MNGVTMLQAASILALLTAAGGAVMALLRLTRKVNPPHWLAMAHGFLAASAFTLLFYILAVDGLGTSATLGLLLLAGAAVGGVVMNLSFHLAGKLIPAWLVHAHIALAVLGTGLVLWGAWWA